MQKIVQSFFTTLPLWFYSNVQSLVQLYILHFTILYIPPIMKRYILGLSFFYDHPSLTPSPELNFATRWSRNATKFFLTNCSLFSLKYSCWQLNPKTKGPATLKLFFLKVESCFPNKNMYKLLSKTSRACTVKFNSY